MPAPVMGGGAVQWSEHPPSEYSSQSGHAAVHEQQGAGDVGGIVGGQNRIAAATSSALPGRFSMVPCAALALYCSTVSPTAAMRRTLGDPAIRRTARIAVVSA